MRAAEPPIRCFITRAEPSTNRRQRDRCRPEEGRRDKQRKIVRATIVTGIKAHAPLADKDTGAHALVPIRPPNGQRVSGERGAEADERVRCTRVLGNAPPSSAPEYVEDNQHYKPQSDSNRERNNDRQPQRRKS